MPFVDEAHREVPDMEIPGDRCFLEYKHIMSEWNASKRWTTIDALAERLYPEKHERAFFLAFLVFFSLHGMEYEKEKRSLNGDVQ
jgi:hypothetical protein